MPPKKSKSPNRKAKKTKASKSKDKKFESVLHDPSVIMENSQESMDSPDKSKKSLSK